MSKHIGKIIYNTIRESTYSFTYAAQKVGITRNALYNKLKNPEISKDLIIKIGEIIHHDFQEDFPDIKGITKNKDNFLFQRIEKNFKSVDDRKYTDLLFQYNSLLDFMISLANDHELNDLKEEIREFVKDRNN